jgi:hypothetical protein
LIHADPLLGSSSVAKIRTSVVFPAPFLPISPKIPESDTEKLTASTAFCSPSLYVLLRFSHTTIFIPKEWIQIDYIRLIDKK